MLKVAFQWQHNSFFFSGEPALGIKRAKAVLKNEETIIEAGTIKIKPCNAMFGFLRQNIFLNKELLKEIGFMCIWPLSNQL